MAVAGPFGSSDASFGFGGSTLGSNLMLLLQCDAIAPGDQPSYAVAKAVFSEHPFGKKMVDTPIRMAQSQQREIAVPGGPEERIREAFLAEWRALQADKKIANLTRISRIYGAGTMTLVFPDETGPDRGQPLDLPGLYKQPRVGINVLDPLNTSGSVILNQDPNLATFQNPSAVRVAGVDYHPSRCCVLFNEEPLYISYTASAYGYVGRSVYARALYPLKSFVQAMLTDDLIIRKAGVIVATMQQPGSVIDNVMARVMGAKRALAKEAITNDVLSIGPNDKIESMNLQNLEGPYTLARKNLVENLALSADMPAKILNSETFAEGFGEGTEDAKEVASYVDSVRADMQPAYDFLDTVCMHRAWSPPFYEIIQRDFPDEYGGVSYEEAFYSWKNSFKATWPSLIREPDSEKIKVSEAQAKALNERVQILHPLLDPVNQKRLIENTVDNLNAMDMLFTMPFELDAEALESYEPPQPAAADPDAADRQALEQEPKEPRADSALIRRIR